MTENNPSKPSQLIKPGLHGRYFQSQVNNNFNYASVSSLLNVLAAFILEYALSMQEDNASPPFLYLRRIICLDDLGQTFLVRLVMRV